MNVVGLPPVFRSKKSQSIDCDFFISRYSSAVEHFLGKERSRVQVPIMARSSKGLFFSVLLLCYWAILVYILKRYTDFPAFINSFFYFPTGPYKPLHCHHYLLLYSNCHVLYLNKWSYVLYRK